MEFLRRLPSRRLGSASYPEGMQIIQHEPIKGHIIRQFRFCGPARPSLRATCSPKTKHVSCVLTVLSPWRGVIPEVEGAHDVSRLQKLPADKAHHGIIIAPSKRSVWMGYYSSLFLPARCMEVAGQMDTTVELRAVVDRWNGEDEVGRWEIHSNALIALASGSLLESSRKQFCNVVEN